QGASRSGKGSDAGRKVAQASSLRGSTAQTPGWQAEFTGWKPVPPASQLGKLVSLGIDTDRAVLRGIEAGGPAGAASAGRGAERRTGEVRAREIGVDEECAVQASFPEGGAGKVGALEPGAPQVGAAEIRGGEVDSAHVRLAQVGAVEIDAGDRVRHWAAV